MDNDEVVDAESRHETPIVGDEDGTSRVPDDHVALDRVSGRVLLEQVERAGFSAFRALAQAVIADYYEAPAVLVAMGWRAEPPQPRGHVLEPADEATAAMIERVKARGAIWRPID